MLPGRLFVWGVLAACALSVVSTVTIPHVPDLWLGLQDSRSGSDPRIAIVVSAVSVLMVPAAVFGGLMPVTARWLARAGIGAGRVVARVYLANCFGSALGAALAGYAAIAFIGMAQTVAWASALACAVVAVSLWVVPLPSRDAHWPGDCAVALALLSLASPQAFDRAALTRGVFKNPHAAHNDGIELEPVDGRPEHELLYYRDGVNATVSVHRNAGVTALRVNGKADASSHADLPTQVGLGQWPLLFGPAAQRVAVIGFASGVTVGSVATHRAPQRIDAFELEPAIVEAAGLARARVENRARGP